MQLAWATSRACHVTGKLPAFDATQGTSAARPGRAYLSNVCVATAARRQGVAQALVAAVEQYLQSRKSWGGEVRTTFSFDMFTVGVISSNLRKGKAKLIGCLDN
eukprot:1144598-Pelagomonas_calceolata.AAC.3